MRKRITRLKLRSTLMWRASRAKPIESATHLTRVYYGPETLASPLPSVTSTTTSASMPIDVLNLEMLYRKGRLSKNGFKKLMKRARLQARYSIPGTGGG